MAANRGMVVWAVGIAAVMLPFLIFVAAGWPGSPDSCTSTTPDTCFCEAFVLRDVLEHAAGVRQPVNTWFNLYAILTALVVALRLSLDRKQGDGRNVMRSLNPIADLYVFAVLFLGLGSMWFHASLVSWAGNFDGLSMYVFASFLVFYTVRRLWASDLFFWLGYAGTVALFLALHALWDWEYKSLVLILVLVAAYLVLEVAVWIRAGTVLQGRALPRVLWASGVGCIGLATLFWALSQTGRPLCDAQSAFQPHGLLWHPLAGAMAIALYFYWREAPREA